jgi:hypothetical protein
MSKDLPLASKILPVQIDLLPPCFVDSFPVLLPG